MDLAYYFLIVVHLSEKHLYELIKFDLADYIYIEFEFDIYEKKILLYNFNDFIVY